MTKYANKTYEDMDITKEELKEIGEALKKEEFRKLFCNYVEEVKDPKNRALYEKEMTQLEKERGVDIKFIHPEPGYVIKSSVDGVQKAFINVCSNTLLGRPAATSKVQDGALGHDWSIPHLLVPPRVDLDKKQQRCLVFDVIFHPETIAIANKNKEFMTLVNDTALSGVEDSFEANIDRNNLRFPKMNFKGAKVASVIRKPTQGGALLDSSNEQPMDIPNYPYHNLKEEVKPKLSRPRRTSTAEQKKSVYTTPHHVVKHRKGIEYHEFLETPDSKVNAVIPSELVIEVHLPLLNSASDATLDVSTKSLSLISEIPSKYKLNVTLPYAVHEGNGSARFDKTTKKLIINLPVIQKKFEYLSREDSGIESDMNHNRSSSDDEVSKPLVEVASECETKNNQSESSCRASEETLIYFLSKDNHYTFPPFSVMNNDKCLSITINVKNVDPSTVCHQYVEAGCGVHFKFTSLGSGFFPIHYAFCIKFLEALIDRSTLKVEVWDNNLVIGLDVNSKSDELRSYLVGPSVDSLEERHLPNIIYFQEKPNLEKLKTSEGEPLLVDERKEDLIFKDEREFNNNHAIPISHKPITDVSISRFDEDEGVDISKQFSSISVNTSGPKLQKVRTSSESNVQRSLPVSKRRSILKTSRSLSESNTDEYTTWSSLDSSDNTEDGTSQHVKKSVRFSDVISKKVFRANSSILGQRYKNEKKSRKKKMAKRRTSESEVSDVSDYSEVSDVSDVSDASSSEDGCNPTISSTQLTGAKKHRRRGSKNSRKNAASAKQNSFILEHD